MISLTAEAALEIKKAQTQKGIEDFGLKVQVVGGGCEGYLYDLLFVEAPEPGDRQFESEGVRLFVDARALAAVDGMTIDHGEAAFGRGFIFVNPKVKSACGCGASFSL
ncbi:MAG TPA: iron-sulfur cluster assembly accessory protein [Myxococcaceae bacterium]|nr:iron-sulfur cluster assembly accessory protein [Myxococcaceae bacterium]